jgi:hypothetical protein
MPGIANTGNRQHDAAVFASEAVLQGSLTGNPTQAQVNSAYVTHFTAVRDSAVANGLPSVAAYFECAPTACRSGKRASVEHVPSRS